MSIVSVMSREPRMSRAVKIPDERAQYFIDFLQKLDRMMTGLPLRMIVKNLGHEGDAITDGKRLWMDWRVLRLPLRTETRLGINYSEVAHCYYGDPRYDRDVTEMKKAANILLDCRDETLFATTYPAVVPYFISMAQELLIKDRPLGECHDVWPLLYGRKYLPAGVRFASAPKHDPAWVKGVSEIIDQFVALPPERCNVPKMLELTKALHERLVASTKNVTVQFVNPGGGRLIRGSRKIVNDLDADIIKKVTLIIDEDRTAIQSRLKVVKSGKGVASSRNAGGGGSNGGTPLHEAEDVEVTVIKKKGKRTRTDAELGTSVKHENVGNSLEKIEVSARDGATGDRKLATEHNQVASGNVQYGAGGAGGAPFQAVELIEDDDSYDPSFAEFVWKETELDKAWATGKGRLDHYRDVLTTDSVRDIVKSLEAEVLFDTDQLLKAGWDGCGAVNATLRAERDKFDRELQLAARTLRSRHALGRRGSVSMKAAMKAERLPDTNIFSTTNTRLTRHHLELEVVFLIDASGSMSEVIRQAMKVQWIIGSAFEKRGAKVTIIPFNNMARDPLKGREDRFSDRIFPFCPAQGGTQPQAALQTASEIFEKAGNRMRLLFMLTDGAWNNADFAHKIIDKMNHRGVMTVLMFMGGGPSDMVNLKQTEYHHCKEGFRITGVEKLLPEMRKTFFRAFTKSIIRTLRRCY